MQELIIEEAGAKKPNGVKKRRKEEREKYTCQLENTRVSILSTVAPFDYSRKA